MKKLNFALLIFGFLFLISFVMATFSTGWFDRDNPSGTGDWEVFNSVDVCGQGYTASPYCVTVSGELTPSQTGEYLHYQNGTGTAVGCYCKNSEQSDGYCLDYKVQFNCTEIN